MWFEGRNVERYRSEVTMFRDYYKYSMMSQVGRFIEQAEIWICQCCKNYVLQNQLSKVWKNIIKHKQILGQMLMLFYLMIKFTRIIHVFN